MKKVIVQEQSNEGLIIEIEHESGRNSYKLTLGSNTIEMSFSELVMLQSILAEILEN